VQKKKIPSLEDRPIIESESRGPVHSGPDHRTSAPYHTELSSMEIKLKINCSHGKKNCFFSEQITIAVGYELANLRVCLALSISDILRAHVVPRLRAVPMILTLVTM
jgi:hypothetical protein